MMTKVLKTLAVGAALGIAANVASAASFAGYTVTSAIIYSGGAEFGLDTDPLSGGGFIAGDDGLLSLQLFDELAESGAITVSTASFAVIYVGTILQTMLSADGGAGADTLSFLFETAPGSGATPFAIGTFTGDLDGGGGFDLFTDGAFGVLGDFTLVGATQDQTGVIPLPATLPLLLAGFGGLALIRRRKQAD